MLQLTSRTIQLHAHARTKEEAIRAAGRVLVENGHIAPGYVESMLGRERQANTYLGHGIAIPHGMKGDGGLIHRTGVSVVQVRGGVEWSPGQQVHLIVGIAAKSDEHLDILSALTDVLDDESVVRKLRETDDPLDIIAGLTRDERSAGEPVAALEGSERVRAVLPRGAGLHARPATELVALARGFQAEIRVLHGGRSADARAMSALLKLGAHGGAALDVEARGSDAREALRVLKAAIESGLGDEPEQEAKAARTARAFVPRSSGRVVHGVAASPGLAIGPLFLRRSRRIVANDGVAEPAHEREQLTRALAAAHDQLEQRHAALKERAGKAQAAIFLAHRALLDDGELLEEVEEKIAAAHPAAWSFQQVIERRARELTALSDERLAARADDLRDVGQRVLALLTGQLPGEPDYPETPFVLVAEDLSPSETAQLDTTRVLGLCTATGGPTSHTAILARTLDIPAVVGAPEALELVPGRVCILDGSAGKLHVEPSDADLEAARAHQAELGVLREAAEQSRFEPALTLCGHRVEVVANIAKVADAALAVNAGGEGVGLLRSEFLFLGRGTPPSEDEQFDAYRAMTHALAGLPLIIRTLDIGGDKVLPYLALPHEDNPFLGVRGIRLCLARPELFLPQLRAIYRAARTGPVKIMFPMIATLEELRAAKRLAEQVRSELDAPEVPIGIMVEVPSVVMMADAFAEEVDFFSIGTNDLTQYALAMDRMHPELGKQADSLHPSVLRMIDLTVRAADRAGKWVGVCGGLAGEPLGAVLLTGLGVRELSMSLPSIAAVKAQLRRISLREARELSKEALQQKTADGVRTLARRLS